MNPFDIVSSVSHTKKRVIDETNEGEYNAFMVNRALSYYPDTIMHAQDMNVNHHLPGLLQYDYLLSSLRSRKRFSKRARLVALPIRPTNGKSWCRR